MPPFQRTAASGTLPIEQTKLMIATSGPMMVDLLQVDESQG